MESVCLRHLQCEYFCNHTQQTYCGNFFFFFQLSLLTRLYQTYSIQSIQNTHLLISGKCSNVHLSCLRRAVLTVAHLHKGEGSQKTAFSEEGCGTAVLGTRLFSTLLCF